MKLRKSCLAAVLGCSVFMYPALGAGPETPPSVAFESPAQVKIPFKPPVDIPLFYRLTQEQTKNGKPVETVIKFTVTFARSDNGYRTTVKYEIPPGLKGAPPSAIGLLSRPLVFQLDQNAEIIGIENELELWNDSIALMSDLPGMDRDENLKKVMDQAIRKMQSMPDTERFALWGKNVQPIWEYASTAFTVGEILRAEDTSQSPFGAEITSIVEGGLARVDGAKAHFRSSTYLDGEDVAAALRMIVDAIPDPARRAKTQAELKALSGVRRDDVAIVSLTTGLTSSYRSEATAGDAAQKAAKIIIIEQLR